jgi:hypothetical protein
MVPSAAPIVEAIPSPEVTEVTAAAPEVTVATKADIDARVDLGVQRAISSGLEADISPDAEIDDSLIDFIENETSCNLKKD